MRSYGEEGWKDSVASAIAGTVLLNERLKRLRDMPKIAISLPSGASLDFSQGEHNSLQKAIIEEFLPRYGHGAEVLYVGDTADKYLHLDRDRLAELRFFEISHDELPDIIAYSPSKNWLYLIEAVHSSGPIDELRLQKLQMLTEGCTAEIIYVTAFQDRAKFRAYAREIAWETEVWIAESPDHLIHFNGDKFLGPYTPQ